MRIQISVQSTKKGILIKYSLLNTASKLSHGNEPVFLLYGFENLDDLLL